MPNGKKKKGHKMATHKRKKRLRKNNCPLTSIERGVCQRFHQNIFDIPFQF